SFAPAEGRLRSDPSGRVLFPLGRSGGTFRPGLRVGGGRATVWAWGRGAALRRGPRSEVVMDGRRVLTVVLVGVASVAGFVAILASWAERTLFASDESAARSTIALESPAVRRALAEELTDTLVSAGVANLSSFRTTLVPLLEALERTDGFRAVFR